MSVCGLLQYNGLIMTRLSLSLLGTWQATLDGESITTFESDKVRALLTYLAVEADRPHRRESLSALFWPERSERNARQNLSQALFNLRQATKDHQAEPAFLSISQQAIQFNQYSNFWLDVAEYRSLIATCGRHEHEPHIACPLCVGWLEEAVALYRGSFLTGISLTGCIDFDEWLLLKREEYQQQLAEALYQLVRVNEQAGNFEQALPYARWQVALNPWREDAQQQLIHLLSRNGRRGEALAQYEKCRQLLQNDLGVEPSAETQALASAIRSGLAAFERFVPAHLVHQLIQINQVAKLSGDKRELTIFFSDITGFTSLITGSDSAALMRQLSTYLSELTTIIMTHNGRIDKYLGDSIMAFWGAPLDNPDHAQEACRAALKCREKVAELNTIWAEEGRPIFSTRMSVNTGETLVGALGPAKRVNYTVLGDSVNLGAQLYRANSLYGTDIVVGFETYHLAANTFHFRPLDVVLFEGKEEPVLILELVGEKGQTAQKQMELANLFTEGYKLYVARRWKEAKQLFEALARLFPDDLVTQMYLVRCHALGDNPPDFNWQPIVHLPYKQW